MKINYCIKKITQVLSYFLFVLLFACSPEYIPNMINTPMLSNKGEIQGNIAAGINTIDGQMAIAITDNFAVMTNASYYNRTSDSTNNFHKHILLEGGLGYYLKLSDVGRFEVFGGYGLGNVEGYYENSIIGSSITDANFSRFFIQPAIGASSQVFDGSFATRFVFVRMNPNGDNFDTGSYIPFIEPAVTFRLGYKHIKGVMQVGFSLPISKTNINFDYQPIIFNVGVSYNIWKSYE